MSPAVARTAPAPDRLWRYRPGPVAVGLIGLALTGGLAVAVAQAGVPESVSLPHWWGGWPHRLPGQLTGPVVAGIVLLGLLCFFWTWLTVPLLGLRAAAPQGEGDARARRSRLRRLIAAALAWFVPLLAGGPMGSLDVQSYAAVGRIAARGLDPYRVSPSWLGDAYGASVDPLWRWTPTPYGPVQVALLRRIALLAGDHVGLAVLLIRGLAVLGLVGAVALTLRLLPSVERMPVFLVTAVNPVVLIHIVSGAHLDVLIGALAVLVVVLSRAGRPGWAMALAVVACAMKLPGAVLMAFVLLDVVRRTPPFFRAQAVLRTLGSGLLVVVAVVTLCPDPFGWLPALRVPGIVRDGAAPSTWVSYAVGALSGHLSGPGLDRAFTIGRSSVALAGVVVVVALLWRATSGTRTRALSGLGWALVALAVSGPSLYPWYLSWGLFAAAAGSGPRGRMALVGLGSASCLLGALSPGTLPLSSWLLVTAVVLGFTAWAAWPMLVELWPRLLFWRPRPVQATDEENVAAVTDSREGVSVG